MKLRDANDPRWSTRYSEIFDASFKKVAASVPRAWDRLEWLNDCLEDEPRSCGVPLNRPDLYGDADIRVWQSPTITGMQIIRVLYEIHLEERAVTLWHIGAADIPDYGIL